MSKPRKKQGNPDFRHRVTCPAPTSEEIESRLIELLTPRTFANLKDVKDKERSLRVGVAQPRHRVLTLAVMVAIVLSLVYRKNTLFNRCAMLPRSGEIIVGRGNISESASVIKVLNRE